MSDSLPSQMLLTFLMGLLGSIHCIGMCGGLVTAVSMSRPQTWWFGLLAYQSGRVSSYAALGLLVGLSGMALNSVGGHLLQGLLAILAGILMIIFAMHLAGWLPDPLHHIGMHVSRKIGLAHRAQGVANNHSVTSWYLLGMANGLLPCGLVYAALALTLSVAQTTTAVLMMISFGLGTIPAMMLVPIILRKMAPALRIATMRVTAVLIMILGLVTLLRSIMISH